MIISKLNIKNILSIKEECIEFGTDGLILLEGYNYDENRGNGSGKTAIFNAMAFALFDKVPRKITKSEILRYGCKNGSARCEVIVGNDVYSVERYRPTKVEYFKNGEKIDIQQNEFEERIGLNYDQFLITMYTAQDAYDKRFISINDKNKKDFILELMRLHKFNAYHKECKDRIKILTGEEDTLNIRLDSIKYAIDIHNSSISDEYKLTTKLTNNKNRIDLLKRTIDNISSIEKPNTEKYDKIRDKAKLELAKISRVHREKDSLSRELLSLKNSKKDSNDIKPDTSCPDCNASLMNTGSSLLNVKDIDKIKKELDEFNSTIDLKMRDITNNISKLDLTVSNTSNIESLLKKIDAKQRDDESEFNSNIVNIARYETEIKSLSSDMMDINDRLVHISNSKLKIKKLKSETSDINKQLSNIDAEKMLISTVSGIFASTGAPAHIMEDFVDNFNDIMKNNVSAIWNNASYSLSTHKVNKDKKVTAKFSETLMINGKEKSIGSLSGGEYRSLSLAADFTILDVLQKQFNIDLNPIILDEPFGGLDAIGKEIVIDLLSKLSKRKQIWIVDHESEAKTLFQKTIRVEKRNNISSINASA